MMDDDQQVNALRERLDEELSGVHVSVAARERFSSRTAAARPYARSDPDRRRMRPAIALPLAAAAVVAVVAIPAYLQVSSGTARPPGQVQAGTAPTDSPTTAPTPSPAATARPSATAAASPVPAPTRDAVVDGITMSVVPGVPEAGQPVRVKLSGALPRAGGVLEVNWGDGTRLGTPAARDCAAERKQVPTAVAHTYRKPGPYKVTAVLDECGVTKQFGLTLKVTASPTSKAASAKAAAAAREAAATSAARAAKAATAARAKTSAEASTAAVRPGK